MSGSSTGESEPPLDGSERAILTSLERGHHWLRAVLCSVTRRGLAYRLTRPQAAQMLLDALSGSPLYKAGQFLFDLMEWEDFMLDGSVPPLLPTALDATSLIRIAALLDQLRTHIDGQQASSASAVSQLPAIPLAPAREDLPPLESGMHLYPDFVLGILSSASTLISA